MISFSRDVIVKCVEQQTVFADNLVLCAMTREEVEENLETWRVVSERHGLKISRTKTDYLPSPTNDTETTVKIVDPELPTMTSFKYLGSLFTSEGGSQADVNNRTRIGWMKLKEVSGVMCDRKMPVKLKDKVFKTIIRPAMTYSPERWAVKKKDENKLNSADSPRHKHWPGALFRPLGQYISSFNGPYGPPMSGQQISNSAGPNDVKSQYVLLAGAPAPHLCSFRAVLLLQRDASVARVGHVNQTH